MKKNCSLNREHYREILEEALKVFDFRLFRERENKQATSPVIYLRHDLDHSLSLAYEMALLEKELNVRSTYFVQSHADFYNPFTDSGTKLLREIKNMGHEIGFHYDLNYYKKNGIDFNKGFLMEKNLIENLIGNEIRSAARHFPHKEIAGQESFSVSEFSLYDAYSPLFIKSLKYISDSGHSWREGCVCQHLHKKQDMQVLTHPVWWMGEGNSWQKKLKKEGEVQAKTLTRETQEIIDYYEVYLKKR